MSTRSRIHPGDGDYRHGTRNGYTNLRCRCADCRTAHSQGFKQDRLNRSARLAEATHGLWTTYCNWSCRCRPCTDAWAAYYRSLTKRRAS